MSYLYCKFIYQLFGIYDDSAPYEAHITKSDGSDVIVEINKDLDQKPELVNEDCYNKGWMVVIEATDARSTDQLLDEAAYAEVVKSAAH